MLNCVDFKSEKLQTPFSVHKLQKGGGEQIFAEGAAIIKVWKTAGLRQGDDEKHTLQKSIPY
jgi:hypothetical protein